MQKKTSSKNYVSRFIFHILFFAPYAVFAQMSPTPIKTSDLDQLRVRSSFSKKIESVYMRKCGLQSVGCYLAETDIDPSGKPSNILVFRAEKKAFDEPATSSLFRWLRLNTDLANLYYNPISLSKKIYSFMRNDIGPKNYFDSRTRSFDAKVSNTNSKLRILAANHMSLEGLKIVNANTDQTLVFDPFVSFSLNPLVALEYTVIGGTRSPALEARLYIASVPADRFISLAGSQCDVDVILNPLFFYDINKCAHGDNASDSEGERNAALFLPMQYLRWVIRFDY